MDSSDPAGAPSVVRGGGSGRTLPEAPGADRDLIARCRAGDQTAWEVVVVRHWRKVFNVAYRFVGKHDEAEDLTQDIFLKIFRALDRFDHRANFQTWLISISRNYCIDHYRSVRKERETIDRDVDLGELAPATTDLGPHAALERADRRVLLRRALEALSPTLRTAVILRDIHELSYHEIAARLRLPEGTVKSRINRGRLELARHILRLSDQPDAPDVRPQGAPGAEPHQPGRSGPPRGKLI